MNLSDQVCSLELAKRLKELSVKQKSYFYYGRVEIPCLNRISENYIFSESDCQYDDEVYHYPEFSAFTVSELGEMLPDYIENPDEDDQVIQLVIQHRTFWDVTYGFGNKIKEFSDNNLSNALAKMLIHLIEQGLMKV